MISYNNVWICTSHVSIEALSSGIHEKKKLMGCSNVPTYVDWCYERHEIFWALFFSKYNILKRHIVYRDTLE